MDVLNNLMSVNVASLLIVMSSFLLVIPALTFHEWAHAWMANRLGDPTARMLGRMTINPLRHIDPIGTVVVPLGLLIVSILTTGIPFTFGWAKPVPFNPRYLKNPKRDTALVGVAGPAMNVILAVGAAIIIMLMALLAPNLIFNHSLVTPAGAPTLTALGVVLGLFTYINLVLCFFNLLPIPPFDGSRIVQKFLTGNARHFYSQLENYGMYIMLGLVFLLPILLGFNLIGLYFSVTAQPLFQLLTTINVETLFITLHVFFG